jgi:hypothetical protein
MQATDWRWVKTETQTPRQDTNVDRAFRRTTMFRKLTLAAVAAASLGLIALAPTSASAGGFFPHHHHHHFGHGHGFGLGVGFAGGGGYDGCWQTRRVLTPFGFRWRTVNVCY